MSIITVSFTLFIIFSCFTVNHSEESFEPPVSPPTEEGNIIDRILYELFLNNLLVSTLKSINRRIVDAFVEYEFYRILVSLGKLVRRNGTDSGGNTTQRPLNFNISSIADLTRPFNPNMTAYADNTPQKITPPTDIFLANY